MARRSDMTDRPLVKYIKCWVGGREPDSRGDVSDTSDEDDFDEEDLETTDTDCRAIIRGGSVV